MKGQHRQKLLRYPLWIPRGLDEAKAKGPWPEWEEKLLQELIAKPTDDCFRPALEYCNQVLRGPWPALEQILAVPPPLWSRAGGQDLIPIYKYINNIGRSSSLEALVLEKRLGTIAFLYAMLEKRARWQEAEDIILDGDTPAMPAVVPNILLGDASSGGIWGYQIAIYTKRLIQGRWQAFEDRVRSGHCNAVSVSHYARVAVPVRWAEAEAFLLGQPEGETELSALLMYCEFLMSNGLLDGDKTLLSEMEKKIAGRPHLLNLYALYLLKSRLPDELHNFMVLESFNDPSNEHIKEYIANFGISAS